MLSTMASVRPCAASATTILRGIVRHGEPSVRFSIVDLVTSVPMRVGARTNSRASLRTGASEHAASTFEDAYSANYRDVYRYLLALTRSRDDADDLTAATFERALRSWESLPATPLPWLLLTA